MVEAAQSLGLSKKGLFPMRSCSGAFKIVRSGESTMWMMILLGLSLVFTGPLTAQEQEDPQPAAQVSAVSPPPIRTHRPLETLLKGIDVHVTWAGSIRKPLVALTFDDGPHPVYTPEVIRILEEHGVPATFFVVGRNAKRHPELLRKIRSAGHALGNHTFSHVKLTSVKNGLLKEELERTREIILQETGVNTSLFRPPFGAFDARCLAEMALRRLEVVLWSVDSRDWVTPVSMEIRHNVESTAQAGAIILLHDVHPQTVEALPGIIEVLKSRGYGFVTVPEMIPTAEGAWGG
jgi:peptidoglycan/xylan/chitin deacetylase (PgdA/CDA1 family)